MGRKQIFPEEIYLRGEANGIPRNVLYKRIKTLGWSVEKAVKTPIMTRKQVGELSGITRDTLFTKEEREYILAQGLELRLVRHRIKGLGWDKETAMNKPKQRPTDPRPRKKKEVKPPQKVIELEPEEYRVKREQIMAMLESAATQEEYERIGAQLLTFKRRKTK